METSPRSELSFRNLTIAIAAVLLSGLLFFTSRFEQSHTSLQAIAKAAVPLEVALANNKPTIVEFYADWCGSCQAMAPDSAALQMNFGDRVNFVMLNVDNHKWLPEIGKYHVDGIPHFVFLDSRQTTLGTAIGIVPYEMMAENARAMLEDRALPHAALANKKTSPISPEV